MADNLNFSAKTTEQLKQTNALQNMQKSTDAMLTTLKSSQKQFALLEVELSQSKKILEEGTKNDSVLKEIVKQLESMRDLNGGSRKEQKKALVKLQTIREVVEKNQDWPDELQQVMTNYTNRVEAGLQAQSSILESMKKQAGENVDKIGFAVSYAFGNSPFGAMLGGFVTKQVKEYLERRKERKLQQARFHKLHAIDKKQLDDLGDIKRILAMQSLTNLLGKLMPGLPGLGGPRIRTNAGGQKVRKETITKKTGEKMTRYRDVNTGKLAKAPETGMLQKAGQAVSGTGKVLAGAAKATGAAGAVLDVGLGVNDLLNGKRQTEMPKGWEMISPMRWGMYAGEKINQAIGPIGPSADTNAMSEESKKQWSKWLTDRGVDSKTAQKAVDGGWSDTMALVKQMRQSNLTQNTGARVADMRQKKASVVEQSTKAVAEAQAAKTKPTEAIPVVGASIDASTKTTNIIQKRPSPVNPETSVQRANIAQSL